MQSTGHTSTHEVSRQSRHKRVITQVIDASPPGPEHRWSAFAGPYTGATRRHEVGLGRPDALLSAAVEPTEPRIVGVQSLGSVASTRLPRRHCTATGT